MPRANHKGFQGFKLLKSFRAAASGFGQAVRTEQNLRIHLIMMFVVGVLGWWLMIEPVEWLLIIFCVGAVISVELMNTGLEYLCDIVRDELKLSYKATKYPRDMAAAAVLIISLMASGVGIAIFLPKLMALFI